MGDMISWKNRGQGAMCRGQGEDQETVKNNQKNFKRIIWRKNHGGKKKSEIKIKT